MMRYLGAIALALLISTPAAASEAVTTAGETRGVTPGLEGGDAYAPPPLSAYGRSPPGGLPITGDEPRLTPPPTARCSEVADRQPHGEVWAGIGTHGYRNIGTAMSAPVGKCGTLSIMVDRTEGGGFGWRR
jgi:hypothetical protein